MPETFFFAIVYIAAMHYASYLKSASIILQEYDGNEPFSSYIKRTFAANKKFGSKDRKHISQLCYCYFRMGKMMMDETVEQRIITGLLLCSTGESDMLSNLRPEWGSAAGMSLEEKWAMVNRQTATGSREPATRKKKWTEIFPWEEELSEGIDHKHFCESFFQQPDLFLRLRPGKENTVKRKLKDAGISFEVLNNSCLALANTTKVDSVIELNSEAVVQDYSSQQTGSLLKMIELSPSKFSAWDCCAASGGKSIMLYDLYPHVDLTVSDIRESILINLKKRFKEAGITSYKSFVIDLSTASHLTSHISQLLLLDAPCTGSGTWSRTPEQLFYFDEKKIVEYSNLQRRIVTNIMSSIKPGGYLLYITCSVFKQENEEIIDYIKQNFHLELIKMEVLKGYDKKADTMFAALLQKPL